MLHRITCVCLAIAFWICCIGCGSEVRVSGKVRFPDGKPLSKGMVCFQSESHVARGEIKSDGSYKLGMEKPGSGVAPGTYQVYISGAVDIEELPLTQGRDIPRIPEETPLIDAKFMGPTTSGITCEVVKGMKLPYDITVERP